MDLNDMDRTVSAPELAKRYKCKLEKIHGWIAGGELQALNTSNGTQRPRWRISVNAIAEFERRRISKPRPDFVTTQCGS